jgi:hypothetical protein
MAPLSMKKGNVPFLLGTGEIAVDLGRLNPLRPIPDDLQTPLAALAFKSGGDASLALGGPHTVKIGLSTAAHLHLLPIFSGSRGDAARLLRTMGLGDFFKGGAHPDRVVIAFDAGAAADATAAGAFAYSALKASVRIEAGGNGGYAYLRAFDRSLSIQEIVTGFFKTMRLPEQAAARPPEPGEAMALSYGGYLRLGAEVAAGYELAGSQSFALGQLGLSERYALSVVGKVGLSAGVAGQFAVLTTGVDDLPGWARVQVRRRRAREMKIAADVHVTFDTRLDDLPSSASDFLGAVLGVNAKSFLSVLARAHELSDYEAFRNAVDALARRYVEELMGKGFDKLAAQAEFTKFPQRVNRIVTSYEQVEDRAVALFDRYFDELGRLTAFLDEILALESKALETLRSRLDAERWKMLAQLTDGDPLGFLVRQARVGGVAVDSLAELEARAAAALDLVRGEAHAEIREAVRVAKQGFGMDHLFHELARIGTVDELQAVATDKVGLFVSRLVGRTLDSATNLKEALREVRAVLDHLDSFTTKVYGAFKAAAQSSYTTALHAEYSRASETDALVDVLIHASSPEGAALLSEAGRGDFERILTTADPDLVRLREGVLTHRTRRERAFRVNIVGWHLDYRYEGFDRVITESEQRLVPSDEGITVLTTTTLEVGRMRKRQQEEMHVNLLLRALGESANVIKAEDGGFGFAIDALSSLSARYDLAFTDDDTSELELRDYLAFAADVGLDRHGATFEALRPLLPRAANGGFGAVTAAYEVRFGREAVEALLAVGQLSPEAEDAIRNGMRRMVLANYLKSDEYHDVAFAYATPAVYTLFRKEGHAAFVNPTLREVAVAVPVRGLAAPDRVVLDRVERHRLATLYSIESSMIDAIRDLYKLLSAARRLSPAEFEKKLARFGAVLQEFDRFDQASNRRGIGTNTLFAMFDFLVRQASPAAPVSGAVLRLRSEANGRQVEKLFLGSE